MSKVDHRASLTLKQQTLTGFEKYGKTTRRAQFLADMDQISPWPELAAAVQTVYPKISENGGRPPIPLERMLRIYFLQLWFNLSDPAVEEALYDSVAMHSVVGIDLGVEGAPDETTVCRFRHLLERNKLGKVLLKAVNDHLHRSGIKITKDTIVDATIIGAPSSTKNQDGQRDPEMHQTAKGQQWYFGMKAHVGVDSKTKLVHTVLASAANVHDREALPYLLHGNVTRVRAKVEHVFGVIKNIFGFRKTRYRGLTKNLHRLKVTAALANLYIVRRRLLKA